MFVSVVNFSIGGLIRRGFNLRPFPLRENWVRSGEAGKVHHRVGGGSVRSTISLFEVGVQYLVIKLVMLLIVSVIIRLIPAVQRAI